MSDYDLWLQDVENDVYALLGSDLDEFDDVDFVNLFEQGYTPASVAQYLYEGEDDKD